MDLHKIKPADLKKIKQAEYTLALRNFLKNKQDDIDEKPVDFILIHDFKFADKEAKSPLLLISPPDSTFRELKQKKESYDPITFGGCILTTEDNVDDEAEEGEDLPEDIGSWKSLRFAANLGTKDAVSIKAALKQVKAVFRFNKLHYTIADVKVGPPTLNKKAGFKLIGVSGYAKMETLQNRYSTLKDPKKQLELLAELKKLADEWIKSHGKSKKSDDIDKKKEMDDLLIWIGTEEVRVKEVDKKKTGDSERAAKVMDNGDTKKFTELDTAVKRLKIEMAVKGVKKTDDEIVKALLKKKDPSLKDYQLEYQNFEFNTERSLMSGEYDTPEKLSQAALGMMGEHFNQWITRMKGSQSLTNLAFSFRDNTFASRIVTAAGTNLSVNYVKEVSDDLAKGIPSENLEIDPEKLKDGDPEANMVKLKRIYDDFMDSIIAKSQTAMTPAFRKYIKDIYNLSLEKRADMDEEEANAEAMEVVGGIFVLRILNPAVAKLASLAKPNEKRTLLLLTKVLQNQANFIEFSHKEKYMVPFNESLRKNKDKLQNLLNEMVS